jgi:pimeloyl-ACP methyl ester carboxylesterase
MDTLEGPIVLAGHSYGGQVITAAATGNETVIALVYIAAFGLDEGESIGALLEASPPGPALHHLAFDEAGYAWLPEEDFVTYFASDVAPEEARVMYATQQPLIGTALTDVMGEPAWKTIPSWYLVATNDDAIPPDAQRLFAGRMSATTVEVESSHVAMYSHPQETADLIMAAAGQ